MEIKTYLVDVCVETLVQSCDQVRFASGAHVLKLTTGNGC